LVANLICMLFYLIGPFFVPGMSWHEPYIALFVAACWGVYGLLYFRKRSTAAGKEMFLKEKPVAA